MVFSLIIRNIKVSSRLKLEEEKQRKLMKFIKIYQSSLKTTFDQVLEEFEERAITMRKDKY